MREELTHLIDDGVSIAKSGCVNRDGDILLNRRAFARSVAGAAAVFLGLPVVADKLVIAVLRPAARSTFLKGTAMGIEEVQRTAALFGKTVEVSSDIDGAQAAVACFDDEMLHDMSLVCEQRGIVLLNCWGRSDEMRRKLCRRTTYHIEASEKMYADAAKLSGDSTNIVLWDSRLERYGAAQLNERYGAFARQSMDGAAWAGWFAVKVAWEAFVRGTSVTSIQFDGHKGTPLSFRTWDHQLRQPLYASGTRVVDVPDVARSNLPSRDVLDTIGDKAGVQLCRLS
jgi:hypothetical protein